jgi:hypothetical protein
VDVGVHDRLAGIGADVHADVVTSRLVFAIEALPRGSD